MKRHLAVKSRSNTSAYEPIHSLCEGGDAGGSATGRRQRSYHPEFAAANLRSSAKISRVLRDFHARLAGLTPKTQE
jgi:hypothetical protein